VLAGRADDEDEPAASARYRRREHARRFIQAGERTSVGVDRRPLGGAKLRRAQEQCCAERSRRIENVAVAVDHLRITFAAFDEATDAVAGQRGVRLAYERGEVLRAEPKFTVQFESEVGVEACVE